MLFLKIPNEDLSGVPKCIVKEYFSFYSVFP